MPFYTFQGIKLLSSHGEELVLHGFEFSFLIPLTHLLDFLVPKQASGEKLPPSTLNFDYAAYDAQLLLVQSNAPLLSRNGGLVTANLSLDPKCSCILNPLGNHATIDEGFLGFLCQYPAVAFLLTNSFTAETLNRGHTLRSNPDRIL
jgi:hypothetical protein